jgi:hypothetical protein
MILWICCRKYIWRIPSDFCKESVVHVVLIVFF